MLRRARWVLGSSPEVARDFSRAAPHAQVAFAPLTLDERHYDGHAALDAPIAGLIGTARWPPTASAVERLLTRVWPRVLERAPQARLRLAGFGMEREAFPQLPGSAGRRVVRQGRLRQRLPARPSGCCSTRSGAAAARGSRCSSPMALGLPIVTTPDGAEGSSTAIILVVETDRRPDRRRRSACC